MRRSFEFENKYASEVSKLTQETQVEVSRVQQEAHDKVTAVQIQESNEKYRLQQELDKALAEATGWQNAAQT